jgi:hypothetical protein
MIRDFVRLVSLMLLAVSIAAFAQKNSQTPQGTGTPTSSSPQSSQQSPSPQGGVTSGSAPIESTAFTYLALDQDAERIVATVKPVLVVKNEQLTDKNGNTVTVPVPPRVVVTTQADVSTVLQWRAVMTQAKSLEKRLTNITTTANTDGISNLKADNLVNAQCKAQPSQVVPGLNPNAPPGQKPGPPPSPTFGGANNATVSGPVWPAELQAIQAAVANVASVGQSLSPSSGNMTDLPLIDGVAGRLSGTVFIPSLLTPKILSASDLGDGPVGKELKSLENLRQIAITQSENLSVYLLDWQTAAANTNCNPQTQLPTAQQNVAKWKPVFDELNASVSSLDAFETGLFAGQNTPYQAPATSAPAQATGNQTNQTGSPSVQNGGGTLAAGQTGGTNPGGQNPGNQSQQAGSILQQILPADLLVQALGTEVLTADNVHFLEVHALESGGSLLTKTTSILGNSFASLHFSGGSVATFTLFNTEGAAECSGFAVSYLGYVKPEDMVSVLNETDMKKLDKTLATRSFSSCH